MCPGFDFASSRTCSIIFTRTRSVPPVGWTLFNTNRMSRCRCHAFAYSRRALQAYCRRAPRVIDVYEGPGTALVPFVPKTFCVKYATRPHVHSLNQICQVCAVAVAVFLNPVPVCATENSVRAFGAGFGWRAQPRRPRQRGGRRSWQQRRVRS